MLQDIDVLAQITGLDLIAKRLSTISNVDGVHNQT